MRAGGRVALHTRTAVVVGVLLLVLQVLLVGVVLLTAGELADRFGAGPVVVAAGVAGVGSWAVAGWFGSASSRAAGEGRATAGVSAAVGAALGYAVGPGLVAGAGLLLSGAPLLSFVAGPVVGTAMAAGVAGASAAAAPHARAPAPYGVG